VTVQQAACRAAGDPVGQDVAAPATVPAGFLRSR
jgi:hypothetical protein